MSQAGLVDIVGATPTIPTTFDTDSGAAIPVLNTLEVLGATVANATYAKAVFVTGSGNTVTVNTQVAAATAAADVTKAGVSTYDSSQFAVDADGHVTLVGGSCAMDSLTTDDAVVVVPDGAGNINILGATGLSTTGAGSTVTVNVSGGGIDWTRVAGTTQTLAVSNGYTNANAALTTFTLPATANVGDIIKIDGEGTNLFKIEQGAGQSIRFGPLVSTVGTSGYALSSKIYDCVTLRCIVEDTTFEIENSVGNIGIL